MVRKNSSVSILVAFFIGFILADQLQLKPELLQQQQQSQEQQPKEEESSGWSRIDVFVGDEKHLHQTYELEAKSQSGQDKLVFNITKGLVGGYFVDLAANDATTLSNSFWLENKHNWKGLCIEANPKYWSRLAYRKCNVVGAVVGRHRMETINFQFGPVGSQHVVNFELSQQEKRQKAKRDGGTRGGIVDQNMDNTDAKSKDKIVLKRSTVTLEEVFNRSNTPEVIDYLSLDVEGAELNVMEAFPFDKYKFKVLTVERPKKQLIKLLKNEGYAYMKKISGYGETIWIKEEFRSDLYLEAL